MRLRLTKPQISAIQCADLDGHGALRAAARALAAGHLIIPDEPLHVEALIRDLTDAANSEDAVWQALDERAAIGACRALTNLARRVRQAATSPDGAP